MSCGSEFFTSNCVCDTLLAIVEAQDQVNPRNDCNFGCNRAIQELVGGAVNGGADTIPVILYCKSTCEPFQGTGVRRNPDFGQGAASLFEVVCGCVFRVVDVDPETCCATLEILGVDRRPSGQDPDFDQCEDTGISCIENLDDANVAGLARSGVCITVDLNCFCGVACVFPQNLR
jgi:hypothetical protein